MANAPWPPEADPLTQAQELRAQGQPAEAVDILRTLLRDGRAGLLAQIEYARALVAAGDVSGALEAARETSLLSPGAALAAIGLGETLLAAGRVATAIAEFQRALRIDPDLYDARKMLGRAWLEAGEPEKALKDFETIPDPTHEIASLIEQAHAMRALPRANPGYVRHLFDQFSTDYDARMVGELGYAAPRILRDLAVLLLPQTRGLAILDLGCGTGLAGEAFRDLAARLDGIDLSPAMIEKARARKIYDTLSVGDLETGIPKAAAYDLVLAADTLVYLGDLQAAFASLFAALKSGGVFLFTVEKLEGDTYALGPKRRWLHSQTYLRSEAGRVGFTVTGVMNCSPRSEAGIPVEGLAMALTKP